MQNKILIIDDDAIIRMMLSSLLSKSGHKVITCPTGLEALELAPKINPDLVLLDLSLPDVSGMIVLEKLSAISSWKEVRIIMLTADDSIDSLIKARDLGAHGYICKPIEPNVFTEMVKDILRNRNLVWLDDYTRVRRADRTDGWQVNPAL